MRGKILMALAGSVLLALSFSIFHPFFAILAWLGFFLFFSGIHNPEKPSFLTGFLAGLVYFLSILYWIPPVLTRYGNLPFLLGLLALLLLSSYLAVYFGVFSWIAGRLVGFQLLFAPFIWVSLEYLREKLLTGFPWGSLGYTQAENLYLLQLASFGGERIISFLIVLFSTGLLIAFRYKHKTPAIVSLLIILTAHFYGFLALRTHKPEKEAFKASLMQGDSSYLKPWTSERLWRVFDQYMNFVEEGLKQGAELFIFPETSIPVRLEEGPWLYFLRKKAVEKKCWIFFPSSELSGDKIYNTAYLISPEGKLYRYRKLHLVPFGEYNPARFILGFIPRIAREIGDFSPGEKVELLPFKNFCFAAPICYEAIFPDLIRKMVLKGAAFIVNPTNDSWYGRTSAPYQHLQQARFRAVETRRYLLRAGSTGISALIDPYGRIHSKLGLFEENFIVVEFRPSTEATTFLKLGPFLNYIYLTVAFIAVILLFGRKKWTLLKQEGSTKN